MKKKRTYQAGPVEQVRAEELVPFLVAGCIIALDVAKQRFVVAVATVAGEVVRLFRFNHPTETEKFLGVVHELHARVGPGKVKAAIEPTGTYGDAIRHQLVAKGVPVWMVSPKRTHDSQALFDNVRSLHDPKSAVLVAKLCAMGLATEWAPPASSVTRLRALVELRRHEQQRQEACFGRLEGALSRHWPEFGQWLDMREQKSALRLLVKYSSPARVQVDARGVRALLKETSRGRLSAEAVEGVISGALATLGVPAEAEQERFITTLATQALEVGQHMAELDKQLAELARDDAAFAQLQPWMGTFTAAVITTHCDPRQYANSRQLEKACGLNLREKSSGEHVGRLTITKRGPGLVRHVLYLFALRMVQQCTTLKAWYRARRGYSEDSKKRAVIAVMRKLVRALFHVARGAPFDASKLFDTRRLTCDAAPTASNPIQPRVTPRPIARSTKRARSRVGAAASG